MSNERQETVADIMDEMREYADSMEKHLIYDLSECSTDYLRVLADRIEDAINRENRTVEKSSVVGNMAKMRDAAHRREIETLRALVEGLLKASSVDCASCGYDCGSRRENCIIKQAIAYLEDRTIKGSLTVGNAAVNPRNCDLLSDAQEALAAIHEDRCYVNNPIDERRLTVEWLFAKANGESK